MKPTNWTPDALAAFEPVAAAECFTGGLVSPAELLAGCHLFTLDSGRGLVAVRAMQYQAGLELCLVGAVSDDGAAPATPRGLAEFEHLAFQIGADVATFATRHQQLQAFALRRGFAQGGVILRKNLKAAH